MNNDQLVKERSKGLAIAKVLVNIHERDQSILMNAHANLGSAYIENKCYEAAFDHLIIAYNRNQLLSSLNASYNKDMLNICKLQSKSCLESHRFDETKVYQDEAEDLCAVDENIGIKSLEYAEVINSKAKFYHMKGFLDSSMDAYQDVWDLYKEIEGDSSDGLIAAWIELIKIDQEKESWMTAESNIKECIEVFRKKDFSISNYKKDFLIELYMQRCEILGNLIDAEEDEDDQDVDKLNKERNNEVLQCLMEIKKLSRELSDVFQNKEPKLILKALHKLMFMQIKKQKYMDALDTIGEIEELQVKKDGEKSKGMAKLWAMRSGIYHRTEQISRAKDCMRRAIMIYQDIGDIERAEEYKGKLKEMEEQYMH